MRRRLAVALAAATLLPVPADASLSAGAGRTEIAVTPAMLPLDGFGRVLDPLAVRVLLLADGSRRVAIAVLDQTSLFAPLVEAIKAEVTRATAADPADILVIASHSFSAPHAFSGHAPPGAPLSADEQRRSADYQAAILHAADTAAVAAARSLAPARERFGQATADVNVNRNHSSADGWWLGPDAAGPSDKRVQLLAFERADGRRVATLVNYPVQSSVMDHSVDASGTKGISADLAGAAMRHLEAETPETVSLFLVGAAGDQMPGYVARRVLYDGSGRFKVQDSGDAAYPLVDLQGERLADGVRQGVLDPVGAETGLAVQRGTVSLPGQERPGDLGQIHADRAYRFRPGAPVRAPFVLVRIGDTVLVGVQAELSAATGQWLRARSPFPHTLVVTMVDGAAKYMPDADAYRHATYEAMNSSFGPGAAETFATAIIQALGKLHGGGAESKR